MNDNTYHKNVRVSPDANQQIIFETWYSKVC